jgi:hypothetical protein
MAYLYKLQTIVFISYKLNLFGNFIGANKKSSPATCVTGTAYTNPLITISFKRVKGELPYANANVLVNLCDAKITQNSTTKQKNLQQFTGDFLFVDFYVSLTF